MYTARENLREERSRYGGQKLGHKATGDTETLLRPVKPREQLPAPGQCLAALGQAKNLQELPSPELPAATGAPRRAALKAGGVRRTTSTAVQLAVQNYTWFLPVPEQEKAGITGCMDY